MEKEKYRKIFNENQQFMGKIYPIILIQIIMRIIEIFIQKKLSIAITHKIFHQIIIFIGSLVLIYFFKQLLIFYLFPLKIEIEKRAIEHQYNRIPFNKKQIGTVEMRMKRAANGLGELFFLVIYRFLNFLILFAVIAFNFYFSFNFLIFISFVVFLVFYGILTIFLTNKIIYYSQLSNMYENEYNDILIYSLYSGESNSENILKSYSKYQSYVLPFLQLRPLMDFTQYFLFNCFYLFLLSRIIFEEDKANILFFTGLCKQLEGNMSHMSVLYKQMVVYWTDIKSSYYF